MKTYFLKSICITLIITQPLYTMKNNLIAKNKEIETLKERIVNWEKEKEQAQQHVEDYKKELAALKKSVDTQEESEKRRQQAIAKVLEDECIFKWVIGSNIAIIISGIILYTLWKEYTSKKFLKYKRIKY